MSPPLYLGASLISNGRERARAAREASEWIGIAMSGEAGDESAPNRARRRRRPRRAAARAAPSASERGRPPLYGALDLGTNNCRLLIAAPTTHGFRVVDAFSRIVRLGEGLGEAGRLSPGAMARTIEALKVCARKLRVREVGTVRCIATQACRGAENGEAFLARVTEETGLRFDVISPQEEARLSVMGCMGLIDRAAAAALVIDIGGGSTELSWIDVARMGRRRRARGQRPPIAAWASMPVGVVTLAERFPESRDPETWYAAMRAYVRDVLPRPQEAESLRPAFEAGRAHLVGTSGTVTSLAGVHLELARYDRSKVDGVWVTRADTLAATRRLQAMALDERAAHPCIGRDRADLVLAGCAILETVSEQWPTERLRVADRGLREGVLMSLIHGGRGRPRQRRSSKPSKEADA